MTGQVQVLGGMGWWGAGDALLQGLFPGVTGECGEDQQTVRAALLGLDMDMDMDMDTEQQAAQLGSALLGRRGAVQLFCGPAGICARRWSRKTLELKRL